MVIDRKRYRIKCLSVPEFSVQFSTPYLKSLIELVLDSGQELAYESFNNDNFNHVNNIQCILGSQVWKVVFSLEHRLKGDPCDKQSGYYLVDNKIIPIGSIELLINNLKY